MRNPFVLWSIIKAPIKKGDYLIAFLSQSDSWITTILPATENINMSLNVRGTIFNELKKVRQASQNIMEKKELLLLMSHISTKDNLKYFMNLLKSKSIFEQRVAHMSLAKISDRKESIDYINNDLKNYNRQHDERDRKIFEIYHDLNTASRNLNDEANLRTERYKIIYETILDNFSDLDYWEKKANNALKRCN